VATPDSPYEKQRFLLLRQFRDVPNALVSGSVLNSVSIEFFLADENTIRMAWFWCNLLGRIKLCVRESDADAASDLVDLDIPAELAISKSLIRKNLINMRIGHPPTQKVGG
jgi:hypothetical protein